MRRGARVLGGSALFGSLLFVLLAGPAKAADFTVTNLNDAGPGSLRQALASERVAEAVTEAEVEAVAAAQRERGGVLGESVGRLDRGVLGRLDIWKRAWDGAGSRVLVGVGPNSASRIPVPPRTLGRELHNDYVAFLIERGVLGLLGLLGLCVVLLRWSGRLLRAGGEGRWRLAGLGGAVIANLPLAASHESFHFRHVWVLFGLVLAAIAADTGDRGAAMPAPRRSATRELVHAGA